MAHFEEVSKETDGIYQASSHDQRTQVTLGNRHAIIRIMMKNQFIYIQIGITEMEKTIRLVFRERGVNDIQHTMKSRKFCFHPIC